MIYLKVIKNRSDDMHVVHFTSGGTTVGKVGILKQNCEELFKKDGINLHKWHSNIPSLKNFKIITLPKMSLLSQSKCLKYIRMKLKY